MICEDGDLTTIDKNLKKVEYISYNDLNFLDENEIDLHNFRKKIVTDLSNKSDWNKQYNAVNEIRRLLKFYKKDLYSLNQIIISVGPILSELSSSIRSNLSKNSLILIKEIFDDKPIEDYHTLKILIKSALIQCAAVKTFIKEQSYLCLNALSKNTNFINSITIGILIEEVGHKNLKISEAAYNTLEIIFSNWKLAEDYEKENWSLIFKMIFNIYYLKREPYNKRACYMMNTLYYKLGEENFNRVIKNEDINLIISMINK